MLTVDDLKRMYGVKEDQELAPIFGRKKGAVSAWRANGVPASIEMKAREQKGNTVINGDNHHIDIHHAHTVEENKVEYSPATDMILDVIKEWDEARRRKLAVKVVLMNGGEDV